MEKETEDFEFGDERFLLVEMNDKGINEIALLLLTLHFLVVFNQSVEVKNNCRVVQKRILG